MREDGELADPTAEELEEIKRNIAISEAELARGEGIPWEEAKRRVRAIIEQRKREE